MSVCLSVTRKGSLLLSVSELRSSESWCAWKVLIARRVEVQVAVAVAQVALAAAIGAHTYKLEERFEHKFRGSFLYNRRDKRSLFVVSCQLKCGMCCRWDHVLVVGSPGRQSRRIRDGSIHDAADHKTEQCPLRKVVARPSSLGSTRQHFNTL